MADMALVEAVLLGARSGRLYFRTVGRRLGDGEHPDACARDLAGPGVSLLHSTSWRYMAGEIVLTYAALPDPSPGGVPVPDIPTTPATDPLAPSPAEVRPEAVAAHACRHLAFLRHTDPTVATHATELWDLIDAFTPALAGSYLST